MYYSFKFVFPKSINTNIIVVTIHVQSISIRIHIMSRSKSNVINTITKDKEC